MLYLLYSALPSLLFLAKSFKSGSLLPHAVALLRAVSLLGNRLLGSLVQALGMESYARKVESENDINIVCACLPDCLRSRAGSVPAPSV